MNRTVMIAIAASVLGVLGVATMLRAKLAPPAKAVEMRLFPSGALARGLQSPEFEVPLTKDDRVQNALHGEIPAGNRRLPFRIIRSEKAPAILTVDLNGNGDLGDDKPVMWGSVANGALTLYDGAVPVDIGKGAPVELTIHWIDTDDPKQAVISQTAGFLFDFGYEITFSLDGTSYKSFILGDPGDGVMIPIDRNGDGRTDSWREQVAVGEPFNYTGTTYRFAMTANGLDLVKDPTPLAKLPLPPDIGVGKTALPIQATTMDGKPVDLLNGYRGKLVMVDFWATWCAPCIGEMPNIRAAYLKYRAQGFEVLGISLDDEGAAKPIKGFLARNGMIWPQIYEGKGWKTKAGQDYDVTGIPYSLLIDGDTGMILATGEPKPDGTVDLRGPELVDFIGAQLEAKKKRAAG